MAPDVEAILDKHEKLKQKKHAWLPLYRALSMFVEQRRQDFTTEGSRSPFILNKVYDSTAPHAANQLAATLLGQLWPNPFESFEFIPQVAQDEQVFSDSYDMMNTVGEIMPANLAIPEANVQLTFHESLKDAGIYGTGAFAVLDTGNPAKPVVTQSIDAKRLNFEEDEYGRVTTAYWEKLFTVGSLVARFGYESVSEDVQKKYDSNKLLEEVRVLQAIEPRRERDPMNMGIHGAAFSSVHVELDSKHILFESGFEEMPIIVFRFWKTVGEVPGRSPAMDALADIRALNKLVELFERAGEMGLDPPRMVQTENVLGGGKIPWGPGIDIPVFHDRVQDGSGRPPIEQIATVQNPSWAIQRISDLRQNIMQYFLIDIMTDLNNTSRQTLGEAHIRNELRMFMTGPTLNRLLLEMLTPFLDRAFNIMLQHGLFGVIRGSQQDFTLQAYGIQPKYISDDFINSRMSGLKGYRLNFISPAARLMKLEEAQGTQRLTDYTMAVSQIWPEAADNFNVDESVRSAQRLYGASGRLLHSPNQVAQTRQARLAQQQAMQQAQQMAEGAAVFKDVAKGAKDAGSAE